MIVLSVLGGVLMYEKVYVFIKIGLLNGNKSTKNVCIECSCIGGEDTHVLGACSCMKRGGYKYLLR